MEIRVHNFGLIYCVSGAFYILPHIISPTRRGECHSFHLTRSLTKGMLSDLPKGSGQTKVSNPALKDSKSIAFIH